MKLYADSISQQRPKLHDHEVLKSVSRDPLFILPLVETNPRTPVDDICDKVLSALEFLFDNFSIDKIDRTVLVCCLRDTGLFVNDSFYNSLGELMFNRFMPHYKAVLAQWISDNSDILIAKYEIGNEIDVNHHDGVRSGFIKEIDITNCCYKVEFTDKELEQNGVNVKCVGTSVPFEVVKVMGE